MAQSIVIEQDGFIRNRFGDTPYYMVTVPGQSTAMKGTGVAWARDCAKRWSRQTGIPIIDCTRKAA